MNSMRISKRIAQSGLCSRRQAEQWIKEGRVTLDGKLLDTPAINVTTTQAITVDGKPLPEIEDKTRLWLFHKPKGTITTHKDPQNRPRVYDLLPEGMPRVVPVGRLDFNTEGLLLLTNDGDLAHFLAHPSHGWQRTYRARVFGEVNTRALAKLKDGVTVTTPQGDKVRYGPIEATLEKSGSGKNAWLRMRLHEGKNREVRTVCSHIGLTVNRLIRTEYGPFTLADLPEGQLKCVATTDINKLKKLENKNKDQFSLF